MKSLLVKILITPLIFVGSFFHQKEAVVAPVQTPVVQLGNDTLPINGSTYNLSGSGVTSSATSFTLSSLTIPQNGYKLVDADASATFYMTLEPGSRTRQEVVSCTTIVQNAAGTATISGCSRGLSPISPYTASSSLKFAHPGGSQVIFGNAAQLFNEYAGKLNSETISGLWTFSDSDTYRARITSDTDTVISTAFVTLGQLSRQAISGASNGSETTKGIFEAATAIEQASSTPTGSTGAILVKQALYSTSSPIRGCNGTSTAGALCSVIAQNNGKIFNGFISTTTAFNWGANDTFTGNNTFSPTTTNTFSTSTMATTTVTDLRNNYGLSYGGKFTTMTTPVTFGPTDTATSTIFSFTLPANALATSSMIHVKLYVTNYQQQNSTFKFALNYGGVGLAYKVLTWTANPNPASGFFEITLMANGSTQSELGFINFVAICSVTGQAGAVVAGGSAVGTYSINSQASQTVSITASYGTSDGSNTITVSGGYAEIIN